MAMFCPGCKKLLPDNPELWNGLKEPLVRNSLSRRDNATYVCNDCGQAEALADWQGVTDEAARRRMEPTLRAA